MEMSLGIIFGLLSMLGYGMDSAIIQKPVRSIGVLPSIFYRNLFVSLFLFIVLFFFLDVTTFSVSYILLTVFFSFIGFVPLVSFCKGLEVGKIGIVTPVARASIVITLVLSVLFFHETLTLFQVGAIFLIIAGIFLISVNFKDWRNSHLFSLSSGVPYALISCVLWGIVFFLFKIPVPILGPVLTAFLIEVSVFAYSIVAMKIVGTKFLVPKKKVFLSIIFLALFGSLGTVSYTLGVQYAAVSIVAALSFSSPLVSTLYAALIYKERLHMTQYVAIILLLSGIVGLSLL